MFHSYNQFSFEQKSKNYFSKPIQVFVLEVFEFFLSFKTERKFFVKLKKVVCQNRSILCHIRNLTFSSGVESHETYLPKPSFTAMKRERESERGCECVSYGADVGE